MCRSRRELSNAYLLAKIGVDTAENEPLEVWAENSIQYSLHSLLNLHGFPVDKLLRQLQDHVRLLPGAEREERVAFGRIQGHFLDVCEVGEVQPKTILCRLIRKTADKYRSVPKFVVDRPRFVLLEELLL